MNKKGIEKEIQNICKIGIDYGEGESQTALQNEIEMLKIKNNIDNGMDLATRTYRVYEYIIDDIRENGEISQFKGDVLYIIHGLLEKQLPSKTLTATQTLIENRDKYMQFEKEKYMENKIQQLENKASVLDKVEDKLIDLKRELEDDGYGYYEKLVQEILNIIKGETEEKQI